MSKQSLIVREKKRAILVNKYKNLRRFLRGKVEKSVFLDEKLYYHNFLQKLSKDSSFTRVVR